MHMNSREKFHSAFSFLPCFLPSESSLLPGNDREEVTYLGIEVEELNSTNSLGCGPHCAHGISCLLGRGFLCFSP